MRGFEGFGGGSLIVVEEVVSEVLRERSKKLLKIGGKFIFFIKW